MTMGARTQDLAARYSILLKRLRDAEARLRVAVMVEENPIIRNAMFTAHGSFVSEVHRHGQVLKLARIIEDPNGYVPQLTPGDLIVRGIPKKPRVR